MSLTEFDELLPGGASEEEEAAIFKQPDMVRQSGSEMFKEAGLITSGHHREVDDTVLFKQQSISGPDSVDMANLMPVPDDSIFKQSQLLPTSADDSLFKQPDSSGQLRADEDDSLFKQPDSSSQLPFPSLDLPDFSHFPIEDGSFGDLEFLDLASDRFLSKSKNLGQYSDIYFNSLATPSGYCSANYLTEEANRLSLLLSESNEKDKGESLDKTLIENLEEIFGVAGSQAPKESYSALDEQLPNVLGSLERKSNYDVEFQVPNDVLSIMAKNLENLEDIGKKDLAQQHHQQQPPQQWQASSTAAATVPVGKLATAAATTNKTITIKSLEPYTCAEPPPGAVAKIILRSSKKHNLTKIIFSSMDDKEQHSFSLNTSDMRRAAQLMRYYNLDNMEALRRLLQLGPIPAEKRLVRDNMPMKETCADLQGIVMERETQEIREIVAEAQNGGREPQHLTNVLDAGSAQMKEVGMETQDDSMTTPAVSPPNSPLPPPVKPAAPLSPVADGQDEEKRVEISNKHAKNCRMIESQLAAMGIKVKILEVQLENDNYYCCPEEKCEKAFISLSDLKLHVMKHYNVKPFQCSQPGCSWSFITQAKLNRHLKSHSKEKEFVCVYNDCGKMFSNKYNLSVHMKAHGRVKEFMCSVCPEKFSTNISLELHLKKHGSQAPLRYSCDFPGCRFVCYVRNHLMTHSRYHYHATQTFSCTHINCNKKFKSIELRDKHVEKHLVKKEYPCDFESCTAKFKTSSQMQRHRRTHTKEGRLQCSLCSRTLSRPEHLRSHYLTAHARDKPLRCLAENCDKKFAGCEILLSHMRQVHKRKDAKTGSLTCPVNDCNMRFVSRPSFQSHLTKHGKENEINSLQSSQETANLDFVALLSSVGEDILLPGELSCPEYEIKTEIGRQDTACVRHPDNMESFVNSQDTLMTNVPGDRQDNMDTVTRQRRTGHRNAPDTGQDIVNSLAGASAAPIVITNNCDMKNEKDIQSYMIPEVTPTGEILISIPQVSLVPDMQPGPEFASGAVFPTAPDFQSRPEFEPIRSMGLSAANSVVVQPELSTFPASAAAAEMTEILIDGISISADQIVQYETGTDDGTGIPLDQLTAVADRTKRDQLPAEILLSSPGMTTKSLEVAVEAEQPAGGSSSSVMMVAMHDTTLNHSTINLQDLK